MGRLYLQRFKERVERYRKVTAKFKLNRLVTLDNGQIV